MITYKLGAPGEPGEFHVRATQADIVAAALFRVGPDGLEYLEPSDALRGEDRFRITTPADYKLWLRFKPLEENDPRQNTEAELVFLGVEGGPVSASSIHRSDRKQNNAFLWDEIGFKVEA